MEEYWRATRVGTHTIRLEHFWRRSAGAWDRRVHDVDVVRGRSADEHIDRDLAARILRVGRYVDRLPVTEIVLHGHDVSDFERRARPRVPGDQIGLGSDGRAYLWRTDDIEEDEI